MKLTTKRNRWFFFRELFAYMIPMILIVGTVDVFLQFIQCPLHPEWSAPCNVIWILAGIYGIFLLVTIICAIISARMLRKVKKQIENEFTETVDSYVEARKADEDIEESEKKEETPKKKAKPRKVMGKKDKASNQKDNTTKKVSKKTTTKKTIKK